MIRFVLPWPPSVNRYWRSVNGRAILSRDGREYRALALAAMIQQGVARAGMVGRLWLSVDAFEPDRRRRDADNLLKAPLDAMAHAGVFGDDSQVRRMHVEIHDPDGRPRLEVAIDAM